MRRSDARVRQAGALRGRAAWRLLLATLVSALAIQAAQGAAAEPWATVAPTGGRESVELRQGFEFAGGAGLAATIQPQSPGAMALPFAQMPRNDGATFGATEGSLRRVLFQPGEWGNLGGVVTSNISCTHHRFASPSLLYIDCFARGADNALHHRWWNGQSWAGWESLGAFVITSDPECIWHEPNIVHCFARGADNALHHNYSDGRAWSGWESLGGFITSKPSCVAWRNRYSCFARGSDNAMWETRFDGSRWGDWGSHRGYITSDPECLGGFAGTACVARGSDNAVWYLSLGHGQDWVTLGGAIAGNISCLWHGGLDCFARGAGGDLVHYWRSGSWRRESLGGIITTDPECVSWPPRIDCFARGTDGAMWHIWWNGSRWSGWESLGGSITTRPECVAHRANRLECYARGTDNAMYHRFWDGSRWRP